MICENTFDTGFYFWLGKIAAEVAWGIGLIVLALVFIGWLEYCRRKGNKHEHR